MRDDEVVDEPVLDLTDRVTAGGEQGLLGLTFSPDGNTMFVHFTQQPMATRASRHTTSRTAATVR